jgi:hypothetical protein
MLKSELPFSATSGFKKRAGSGSTDIGVTDKLSPFRNLNNFSSQVVSQRADNVSDNLQGEK